MQKELLFILLFLVTSSIMTAQTAVKHTIKKYEAVIFTIHGGEVRGILSETTDSSLIIYPDYNERAFKKGIELSKLEVKATDILKIRLRKNSTEGKLAGAVIGGVAGGLLMWTVKEIANDTANGIVQSAFPYANVKKQKTSFDGINVLGIAGGAGIGIVIGSRNRTKKEYFIGGNPDFFKPLIVELKPYEIQLISNFATY